MVLEIRLSNFFSMRDEVVLDLRAAGIKSANAQALKNNIFGEDKSELLKTVVIYGANASGKSNIIKAIRFCNSMVFESHNHNENTVYSFIPFKFEKFANKPSSYFIRFISNGIEYEYSFTLTRTKILTESLYYYPKGRITKIFTRDERKGKTKKEKYSFGNLISAIENVTNQNKQKLIEALKIADSDIEDVKIKILKKPGKNVHADLTNMTLKVEDVVQNHLEIKTYHKNAPDVAFDFLTEESSGTIKLFFIMLTLLDVVKNNKVLLIDEIEESLHPKIIEYIFNLFRAGEKAQLICTTHYTQFLDLKKFRKDQIYFANKKTDGSTDLYSLYDYSDFRDTMDLEKAYLQGRFDAIPIINDSYELLKNLLNEK